ncbi:MAG TPA: DNA mismatch repair endonuclease MutL [Gemmataceae bacterium]|nr:DNA mismatch repair endonuclease MutL [Gemmataceae bacterium]
MARIQQLSPLVVNKIAAGEVIERPASVVKELLENAVDAGSRRIDVEIEQGGVDLIRVVDDGCGILADDLPLAFASHATSKLASADDLFHIETLGFRGEALASIGGVAQVALQSRPPDQTCGSQITCNGGELGEVRPWNGSPGTRMEVRHLFYNTPVRRKFLRTPATEMGHISEAFTRLSMAHSRSTFESDVERGVRETGLHLTLRHNNKTVYDIPASTILLDRIAAFFGTEVSNQLYAVESHQGSATLTGYIADPACERGTARMQYLFINGRWVRDRTLGHAIQEAYRGLLMTGRYAVTFLFIDLPPDQVDVNVHPTKAEVRFRDSQALHHLVFSTIRQRLRAQNLTARLQLPSTMRPTEAMGTSPASAKGDSIPFPIPSPVSMDEPIVARSPDPVVARSPDRATEERPKVSQPEETFGPSQWHGPETMPQQGWHGPEIMPQQGGSRMADSGGKHPPEKIIQLYDSYLVVETEEGMLVIDQHALHERILFEQIKRRIQSGPLETQPLLIPEPVELTAEQAARTLEHRDALAELGLGIEDFGGGTILLTSYPALLGRRSPQTILRAVVDHLISKERAPSREVLFNDLMSLMACHAAVRAGDRLTPEQMAALVEQRQLADDTHHCPHGRPTALLFSRHDLERQFRRV